MHGENLKLKYKKHVLAAKGHHQVSTKIPEEEPKKCIRM